MKKTNKTHPFSDLSILEEIKSEIPHMKDALKAEQDDDLKDVLKRLEIEVEFAIQGFKNPKKFIAKLFEKRVDQFYKPYGELTSDYFDFLHTYLLCCYFSIKYINVFGKHFPPDEEDYMLYAELVANSYESASSKQVENKIYKKSPPLSVFYKDADRRFCDIQVKKDDSFIRLADYCRCLCFLLDIYLRMISDQTELSLLPDHPFRETIDRIRNKNIDLHDIKAMVNGWGIDLICKSWEVIGYWTGKMDRKKSAILGAQTQKRAKEKRISDVTDKVEKAGRMTDESCELTKEEWYKILKDVFGYSYVSYPTSKKYLAEAEKGISNKLGKKMNVFLKK
jgi:hypothetical protein